MLQILDKITAFVSAYPHVAYGLVFIVALVEAMPVAGVIVPGSMMIIAVSALVPSGAVAFWPLLGSAVLGAVIGDGFSYWLGRRYQRAILTRWPFSRYSQVVAGSEAFFARHGGKSVFLGRFVPAFRAFAPLIAGILRMPAGRFYLANLLSALAWAPAHILPGVLLGASLGLAAAAAGRLATIVLALLVLIWAATWFARYALGQGIRRLDALERGLRAWAGARDSWARRQVAALFDPRRPELRGLLLAAALSIGAVWLFLGLLEDIVTGDPLVRLDSAVYQLFQQVRTPLGDRIMVSLTELGDSAVVLTIVAAVFAWLLWQRAWRTAAYWIGAVGLASLFNTLIKATVYRSRPSDDLYSGWAALSFPSGHSAVNTVIYAFLTFLAVRELRGAWRVPVVAAATLVVSIALSRIYLGAHWFSDVMGGLAFGVAWSTFLAIAYVHHNPPRLKPWRLLLVAGAALLLAGGANIYFRNGADVARYAVRDTIHQLEFSAWLSSEWRRLPARRVDLVGEQEEPLAVQWAGSLASLEEQLLGAGWQRPRSWSAGAMLGFLASAPDIASLPPVPLLHDGRPPSLTLVYPRSGDSRLVLWLWATALAIGGDGGEAQPIWVGAVLEQRTDTLLSLITVPVLRPDATGPRQILAGHLPNNHLVQRGSEALAADWDGQTLLAWDSNAGP